MIDEKKSTYNSSNTDEEGEFCDNCGEKLLGDDNFCPKCGNSVFYKKQEETEEVSDDKDEIEEIKCPYCDSEIPNNVSKCCHCGEWVDKSKDPSISNKINTVFDEVRDEIKNIDTDDIKDTASKGIDEVLDEIKNIDTDDIKDTVSKGIDEVCDEIKNIYTDDIKGKIIPPKKISFVSNRKKLIFVAIALIAIIAIVGGILLSEYNSFSQVVNVGGVSFKIPEEYVLDHETQTDMGEDLGYGAGKDGSMLYYSIYKNGSSWIHIIVNQDSIVSLEYQKQNQIHNGYTVQDKTIGGHAGFVSYKSNGKIFVFEKNGALITIWTEPYSEDYIAKIIS